MTWADFYLICFLVGIVLSLLSFLGGSAHFHLPHLQGHQGGLPGAHGGHAGKHSRGSSLSPVNCATITAFLAWFGGTGYLMSHYYGVWFLLGLGVASASGLAGAAAIFWFVAKVLVSRRRTSIPPTTRWSACSGASRTRSGRAGPGSWSTRRRERGGPPARAARTVSPSRRESTWWSRATRRGSPTSARGRASPARASTRIATGEARGQSWVRRVSPTASW